MAEKSSGRPYVFAWLGLLALTAVSFGVTHVPALGEWGLIGALTIAAVKAGIVLVIFMHLSQEPFTIRFTAAITLIWVALICVGVVADVGTR